MMCDYVTDAATGTSELGSDYVAASPAAGGLRNLLDPGVGGCWGFYCSPDSRLGNPANVVDDQNAVVRLTKNAI